METSLRIIPSEEEASLHPRAIWNHWKKNIIWDPRSYYGVLEFFGILVCILTLTDSTGYHGTDSYHRSAILKLVSGLLLFVPIAVLHWYSNHRQSNSILTRSRTHIVLLFVVALLVFGLQIMINLATDCIFSCEVTGYTSVFLWLSILILFGAMFVIYQNARNPRRDPVLAELPSPTTYTSVHGTNYNYASDMEDSQRVWAESTTIAEGIEDDSLEPEGQLRL